MMLLYEPAVQLKHAAEVAASVAFPKVPPAQAVQTAEVEAAATVPNLPNEQPVHAEVPVDSPM